MAEIGNDIVKAATLLRQGELVAMPTETVYGLSGSAFNIGAITNIFSTKNRPAFDPLIVHVADMKSADHLVSSFPRNARLLAERFWPGPLTLLLPKKSVVPDLVTSGLDTVAIRVPQHPLALQLLSSLDFPLVAPSANPFGYVSPTTAKHVDNQLGDKIKYILDGGPCQIGVESTVVGFEADNTIIHRPGGLSKEKIESIVGEVEVLAHSTSNPQAPGMLKSHYSPRKKVIINNSNTSKSFVEHNKPGAIVFNRYMPDIPESNQIMLAPDSELATAAKNLFSALRVMDQSEVSVVLVELVPSHGLGLAINDRLKRAAAR